jgi:hypothetical protein
MGVVLCVMGGILCQGLPRDSSDEEWEAAYASLDPVAQIGWRNLPGEGHEVGELLVRDVFEAADVMHDNAMSEMEGNTEVDGNTVVEGNTEVEDARGNVVGSAAGALPLLERDSIMNPLDGMDVSQEGENSAHQILVAV